MWLTIQELVGGCLMSAAGHGALLEEKRVQLADRSRPLREVIHQLSLMDSHLFLGECLRMKVHNSHGVALSVGPHRDLSPVTPLMEQQAGLKRGEAKEVLVAPGYQFVLLRHAEQVVPTDAHNIPLLSCSHVIPNSFGVSIDSSVDRKRGLVPVAIRDW